MSTSEARSAPPLGRRVFVRLVQLSQAVFVVFSLGLALSASGANLSGADLNWRPTPLDADVEARMPLFVSPQPSPITSPSPAAANALNTSAAALLARTPPMGWNGYNRFSIWVNAATVEAEAHALVGSGMKEAGYVYVNLDGGWDLRHRDSKGNLVADPVKFPQGIRPLADYVHSLGLKFGMYVSAGTLNCKATSAGSYGHYQQDAATFAAWQIDYLKFDWCYVPYGNNPQFTQRQLGEVLAAQMGQALAATGRPILFDANDPANTQASSWARGLAHIWRTAPDIADTYQSMVWNFTHSVALYQQAGPGGWNDPDMLEIGNGGMTATEYQSQFSLWAEMAAPLIAGNDLTRMSDSTRRILTNPNVIAVDQDPLGRQGYPVMSSSGQWVLTKPLLNGDKAVVLFNESSSLSTMTVSMARVGLSRAPEYTLVDLWSGSTTVTTGPISVSVPPHGVVMYRISRSGAWGSLS